MDSVEMVRAAIEATETLRDEANASRGAFEAGISTEIVATDGALSIGMGRADAARFASAYAGVRKLLCHLEPQRDPFAEFAR